MVSPTDLQMVLLSPVSKPSLLLFASYLIVQNIKVQLLNSWQVKIFITAIKHVPSRNLATNFENVSYSGCTTTASKVVSLS